MGGYFGGLDGGLSARSPSRGQVGVAVIMVLGAWITGLVRPLVYDKPKSTALRTFFSRQIVAGKTPILSLRSRRAPCSGMVRPRIAPRRGGVGGDRRPILKPRLFKEW